MIWGAPRIIALLLSVALTVASVPGVPAWAASPPRPPGAGSSPAGADPGDPGMQRLFSGILRQQRVAEAKVSELLGVEVQARVRLGRLLGRFDPQNNDYLRRLNQAQVRVDRAAGAVARARRRVELLGRAHDVVLNAARGNFDVRLGVNPLWFRPRPGGGLDPLAPFRRPPSPPSSPSQPPRRTGRIVTGAAAGAAAVAFLFYLWQAESEHRACQQAAQGHFATTRDLLYDLLQAGGYAPASAQDFVEAYAGWVVRGGQGPAPQLIIPTPHLERALEEQARENNPNVQERERALDRLAVVKGILPFTISEALTLLRFQIRDCGRAGAPLDFPLPQPFPLP